MSESPSNSAIAGDEGAQGGGGGWLGWCIQAAKDKSAEALSLVKRDLVEFTATMHDDGAKVASSVKEKLSQETASVATQRVRAGMSSLIGGLSKALVVPPSDDYRPARIVAGEAVVFDRAKARLHAIQVDPQTYTMEPADERYQTWLTTFDLEAIKGDISQLLVSNMEVRALYTQLVPLSVSNVDFWRRYEYALLLLGEDEARRRELKKRAEAAQHGGNDDAELGWGDDEEDDWGGAEERLAPPSSTEEMLEDTSPSSSEAFPASSSSEAVSPSSSSEAPPPSCSNDKHTSGLSGISCSTSTSATLTSTPATLLSTPATLPSTSATLPSTPATLPSTSATLTSTPATLPSTSATTAIAAAALVNNKERDISVTNSSNIPAAVPAMSASLASTVAPTLASAPAVAAAARAVAAAAPAVVAAPADAVAAAGASVVVQQAETAAGGSVVARTVSPEHTPSAPLPPHAAASSLQGPKPAPSAQPAPPLQVSPPTQLTPPMQPAPPIQPALPMQPAAPTQPAGELVVDVEEMKSSESGQSSGQQSLGGWSALSEGDTKTDQSESIMVLDSGAERTSPSDTKESLDDDWEKDFDVEVTEAELKSAQEALKNRPLTSNTADVKGEDWEDW